MKPVIDFQHVLNELSVNRNDPCEVIRELTSNAYDAGASKIRLAIIHTQKGICFFDNGSGLSRTKESNGITPYAAFFSIGKSTKIKGDGGIGYKCQGSKLCFAANRVLVITKTEDDKNWVYKIIENPRKTLSVDYVIDPQVTIKPATALKDFFSTPDNETHKILGHYNDAFFDTHPTGTLIVINNFDTEAFSKHFVSSEKPKNSYIYNYIQHYTKHGDTTYIKKEHGFTGSEVMQVVGKKKGLDFQMWNGFEYFSIPYGFPYLPSDTSKDIKGPLEVARIRDGRFYCRNAKRINFSSKTYAFILAVDGNRRAHDGYSALDRKGATKSGIRLSDQRGVWISSNGIKISRYNEILLRPELEEYAVLSDAESSSHYHLIIDGDFELVTNRNSISRNGASVIEDTLFIAEIKKFLDSFQANNSIFRNLLIRLRREQSDAKLNQQIDNLERSKEGMKERERFEVTGIKYVSPLPGEEYLVGVLYAELGSRVPASSKLADYWKRVLTFSTLGIDSLASIDGKSLKADKLLAIEYKYIFSNLGPFNHALCIVDYIVAWELELENDSQVRDDYGCYGDVIEISPGYFEIQNINHVEGDSYDGRSIKVVSLKQLIADTFSAKFSKPPKS